MSFGLATVIVFILVAPGFCLAYSIRLFSKYDINIGSENATSQIIFLVILALLLQILTIPSYIYIIDFFVDIDIKKLFFENQNFLITGDNNFNFYAWFAVAGYLAFTFIISGLFGWIFIKAIESGRIPFPYFHGSMYDLIVGSESGGNIFCSILTKSSHNGCYLMYRGTLDGISYVSKNKVEYVFLKNVFRYLIKIDSHNSSTSTSTKMPVTYFHTNNAQINDILREGERFYVDGEEIANILFSKYPFA